MRFYKLSVFIAVAAVAFVFIPKANAYDANLANRLKGRILLQVQDHGEAWYIRMSDAKRYYMADGAAAYEMMRFLARV